MHEASSQKIAAALVIVRQAMARIDALSDGVGPGAAGTSLRAVAERLYLERRKRDEHFPSGLFGEPAWDLLLALFIAREEGRQLNLEQAYRAAGVGRGAGRALIGRMEAAGLVARNPSGTGRRQLSPCLTKQAVERLSHYLTDLI